MKRRTEILEALKISEEVKRKCKERLDCGSPKKGDDGLYRNIKVNINTLKWVLGIK